MQDTGDSMIEVEMQECIQDCLDCHKACVDTVESYKQAGNDQAQMQQLTLPLQRAEIVLSNTHFSQSYSTLSL